MTNLEIFFMVMFFATLVIAIIAIINCVRIDKAHNNIEMKLLDEAMFASNERLKLLTEISVLEKQLNETKEELEETRKPKVKKPTTRKKAVKEQNESN